MNRPYCLEVKLWVRGPLITSAGGNSLRGLDRMFNRSSSGNLVLQKSHIKGKLRDALTDLKGTDAKVDRWFGRASADGSFAPSRGEIGIDDFYLEQAEAQTQDGTSVRVSIDHQTGTGREHQLFTIERQFPSGSLTVWKGNIRFWEADQSAAKRTADELRLGLKWINTIGGIKGIGYGRLVKVTTKLVDRMVSLPSVSATSVQNFRLQIALDEDLFIGGVANSTNYLESQEVIPGAVLKGSLSKFLNEMCGEQLTRAIDINNPGVAAEFPNLVKNFWAIRFTHAFPVPPSSEARAVSVPASAVTVSDDKVADVAFCKDGQLDERGRAPLFAIDWKDPDRLKQKFGWGRCQTVTRTQTRIHRLTRTAEENDLYTFRYVSPYYNGSGTDSADIRPKVRWTANVTLPGATEELVKEFFRAIHSGWNCLGKRNSLFQFVLKDGHAKPALQQHDAGALVDGKAIVSLQTDALLLDGYDQIDGLANLQLLYEKYWDYATKGTCRMSRFFARQGFSGGYVASVYRLHANSHYFPYALTKAGSVFVLESANGQDEKARAVLENLQETGLPLPQSIVEKMSIQGLRPERVWNACPFVPENGFGEIVINLNWHWENQLAGNNP